MIKSYILVVDTFEQDQFPVGSLSMGLILEGPTQLFHCHWDSEDCVKCRTAQTSTQKEEEQHGYERGMGQ